MDMLFDLEKYYSDEEKLIQDSVASFAKDKLSSEIKSQQNLQDIHARGFSLRVFSLGLCNWAF